MRWITGLQIPSRLQCSLSLNELLSPSFKTNNSVAVQRVFSDPSRWRMLQSPRKPYRTMIPRPIFILSSTIQISRSSLGIAWSMNFNSPLCKFSGDGHCFYLYAHFLLHKGSGCSSAIMHSDNHQCSRWYRLSFTDQRTAIWLSIQSFPTWRWRRWSNQFLPSHQHLSPTKIVVAKITSALMMKVSFLVY